MKARTQGRQVVGLSMVALAAVFPAGAEDLDEMVVTANRAAIAVDRLGSSVTVITHEEIEARQTTKVEDLLREVPGVSVTRNGGAGATTQINIRGTNSNHSTVLVDGQRMNFQDVSSNTFDYDWLTTDNIERIEILRGPSAGQWGGDTIGGVVNIVTKKGQGPMKVTASAEGGSFGTNRESVSASGGGERYDYAFGWSNFYTDGWSTAPKSRGWGTEPDSTGNQTTFAKIGLSPTENSEIELRYAHTDFDAHLDGQAVTPPGATMDTHIQKFKRVDNGHVKGQIALLDGFWTPSASASFIHNDQWQAGSTTASTGCLPGAVNGNPVLCAAYDSWSTNFGTQHDLKFDPNNTLTFGAESTRETYWQKNYQKNGQISADKAETTSAGYIQHQTRLFDILDIMAGYRGGGHDTFGLYSTYFGNAALHLPTGTTLKGSFGTSFKAPSLYQIYYPSASGVPNPALQPEKGRGWDLGFEQTVVERRVKLGGTFFRNDISNLIDYRLLPSNLYQYQNVAKATTYGVEAFVDVTAFDDGDSSLTLTPNYTYTQAYSRGDFAELTRRPRHALGGDVTWRFLEKRARVNLATTYNSDHQEIRSSTAGNIYPDRFGGYAQFDLAASYDVTDSLQVFGRVDNLLDRYHESAFGYAETGGRAFFAGVKVSFEPLTLAREAMK